MSRTFYPIQTNHPASGFTLIEMIVSLALFSVVITTSVGALLALLAANQQLQGQQGVMTNLAFALDSMTREIRTGYNYHCLTGDDLDTSPHEAIGPNTQDCADPRPAGDSQRGVSFYEGGRSITSDTANRIMYYFDSVEKKIMRRVGDNPPQSIVSSALEIIEADFRVTGSIRWSGPGGDTAQPTVTLSIRATEVGDSTKEYRLQTTVTQRILDL